MTKLKKRFAICPIIMVIYSILIIFKARASETPKSFELPINGSSGYALISLQITDENGNFIQKLQPGDGFAILEEKEDSLLILCENGTEGFVPKLNVLVNLPDVIPSIIYNDTNSDRSMFRSSGHDLPNITGRALYQAKFYNERLGYSEYVMPVLFSMAEKIVEIQQDCINNGDSLILYESYRPYDVQMDVSSSLQQLSSEIPEVKSGMEKNGYNLGWFIATQRSNHQMGVAIDVSLGKVEEYAQQKCGGYLVNIPMDYMEYEMPTDMHELSTAAATFNTPVSSSDKEAWKTQNLSDNMTESSIKLQKYCTDHGLYPLASEWWHFNDLDTKTELINTGTAGSGAFHLYECISKPPANDT